MDFLKKEITKLNKINKNLNKCSNSGILGPELVHYFSPKRQWIVAYVFVWGHMNQLNA